MMIRFEELLAQLAKPQQPSPPQQSPEPAHCDPLWLQNKKCDGGSIHIESANQMAEIKGSTFKRGSACSGGAVRSVSKAALDQFTRCVSLELAVKQIRVNSVNPGVNVTELQKRGGLDTERYEKFLEHSKTTHALGRPGEAGEVP